MEDIEKAYIEAWKLGLKAVAVYRDGCKRTQPLNTSKDKVKDTKAAVAEPALAAVKDANAVRRRLPDERQAITHKFSIGGHEGYLTVGMYEDGTPGELFCVMAKEGSVVSGLMDSFATAVSLALQYGVPLQVLVDKFSHTRFEPSRLHRQPGDPDRQVDHRLHLPVAGAEVPAERAGREDGGGGGEAGRRRPSRVEAGAGAGGGAAGCRRRASTYLNQADAPPCHTCGEIMVRNGACYKCSNCGATSGCS